MYNETVLEHGRNPRNKRAMSKATAEAPGRNRLCGDSLTLYVRVEEGRIADVSFDGRACAIATAAASVLSEIVCGAPPEQVVQTVDAFEEMLRGEPGDPVLVDPPLDAFAGLRAFPMRTKCALLPWRALAEALRTARDGGE